MIPKIIHQVFFNIQNKELEEINLFVESQKSLQKMNPDFEYILWTEEACDGLMQTEYQEYYDFYKSMRYDIQRIDYVRFFILHKFGGFYIDLDMIAIKPLDELLKHDMILNNINHLVTNHNEFVLNDFMATKPENPLMMLLIKAVPINYKQKEKIDVYNTWKARFVVQTTGPKFLSRMIKKFLPNYKPMNVVWTKWRNENWKTTPRNDYYVECYRAGSWLHETNKNLKTHDTFK